VVVDGTSAPDVGAVMFGLVGFRVLAAGVIGGELELLVETTAVAATCPSCAGPASPHARREHMLRDTAQGDRPVFVLWCKRIWRCRAVDCPKATWSEQSELAASKATLTGRVRAWAARRVGEHADTVAATARLLGVGWHTVMGAVREHGEPLVDDPSRLDGVSAWAWTSTAGMRERVPAQPVRHRYGRPSPGGPARLLDVVAGAAAPPTVRG
jgi:hypothetical protein